MSDKSKGTQCCPQFDPSAWDDKIVQWDNKRFVKDKVFTLFYMPINFGQVIKRLMGKVTQAGAESSGWLCLSDHTSKWNMDIYLAVDKEVPQAQNVCLSGRYFSKVYEGPFRDAEKWCKDFRDLAGARDLGIKKLYMWYTTCPKCAKKYGQNYVVIIASV
jgi:hypothetical protein